jgi:hypothetical protein
LIHFSFHRWLDQGEDDGKIVREVYARDNSIFSASECHTHLFLEKLCFIMTEQNMILLKLMILSFLYLLRAEART